MGLGNPEPGYRGSPHNAGFDCIDHLDRRLNLTESMELGNVTARKGKYRDHLVVLARPLTYMNASGEGVARLMDHLEADISELVVITDDMDLFIGEVRVKPGGSPGTHRGMQSVVSCLGRSDFARVRIGIQPLDQPPSDLVAYVLTPCEGEMGEALRTGVERAADASVALLNGEMATVMNRFNRKSRRENENPGKNILFAPTGGCRALDGSGAAQAALIQKESLCIDRTKSGSF